MEVKNYLFEDLEILADGISKIKKKDNLIDIRDIVLNNNPNIAITENSNGIFFQFTDLNPNTYVQLEKYLEKSMEKNKKKNTDSISLTDSLSNSISVTNGKTNNEFDKNHKLKYNNQEKSIIKRKIYDENLMIEEENYEGQSIFVKKNSTKKSEVKQ